MAEMARTREIIPEIGEVNAITAVGIVKDYNVRPI
jgi:hypothetical protein